MFAPESLKDLGEGEVEDRLVEAGFIAGRQEIGGGFALGVNLREPLLFGDLIPIAAVGSGLKPKRNRRIRSSKS